MRNAFAAEMVELAATDERIVLLSGDIGNRLFNPYKERFPDRFVNCGVAEANMIGMAAGMALSGLRPVAYTITPFITTRCLEQIRLDLCYHDLPVTVVGVGAGLAYAGLGATHHALEDLALLRALPNMTVAAPGDAMEVRSLLRAATACDGPVYLRMGKKNEPVVHAAPPELPLGKGMILEEGSDAALIACGVMLPVALEAAAELKKNGVTARVVSLPTVKPLDLELIQACFDAFPLVATLEEHGLVGGLGAALAEWAADLERPPRARLLRFGTGDAFFPHAGNQEEARGYFEINLSAITDRLMGAINPPCPR